MKVKRLVRTDYELQDAANDLGIPLSDAARDVALLSIMASLQATFAGRIVFKGGSVLRYAWGASRTSGDTDATIVEPAHAPLGAADVRAAIVDARSGQFLRVKPPAVPRTDNKYSLDFNGITYQCADIAGFVNVEMSYREDVALPPLAKTVGPPYFEAFKIATMQPPEMAAEKLRTLAQRTKATDLSDCVRIEGMLGADDLALLPTLRERKFTLVRNGLSLQDHLDRIDALEVTYERDVRPVDPTGPSFVEARAAAVKLARAAWK